jgi:hypothetical protein
MFIIKTNWAKRVVTPEFDWMPDRVDDFLQLILDKTINSFTRIFDRRSFIKFNRSDFLCIDSTLSDIILPLVKEVKREKQGVPCIDNEDVPEELRTEEDLFSKCNHSDKEMEILVARWDYILDEMIFAFEKLKEANWEAEFHSGHIDFKFTPVDKEGNEVPEEGAELFRMDRGPNDTHELDIEGLKAMDARIQNGTMLFGKYYRDLWL